MRTMPALHASTKVLRRKEARSRPLETPSLIHEQRAPPRSACACGGGCPRCGKAAAQRTLPVSEPGDALERDADEIAAQVMRTPETTGASSPRGKQSPSASDRGPARVEAGAQTALTGAGVPLPESARAFFEPRFDTDFSEVRVHSGPDAARSAASVQARAYAFGRDVVFARGEYAPGSNAGKRLLAHELAHVVQQRASRGVRLQRTPARQVSCANTAPLHIPGPPPVVVADPVGVITAAENSAGQMFDDAIAALAAGRQRIIAGAPAAWPTITDALAQGLALMGLDPEDPAVWTAPSGTGVPSVPLLLRRLRAIRSNIGAGSFFFFCLGTGMARLGTCAPLAGQANVCGGAEAATCAGQFLTAFCPTFWTSSPEQQAATLIHETAHNFATFIGHTGRFTNAECFARLVQVFAGVAEAEQRLDLCPNP
jgi:Domain of unknown function (DUF4157)